MKTDLYTKAVLTVIAVALVCLVFRNFNVVTPAQASTSPVMSTMAEPQSTHQVMDVNVKTIDGKVPCMNYWNGVYILCVSGD